MNVTKLPVGYAAGIPASVSAICHKLPPRVCYSGEFDASRDYGKAKEQPRTVVRWLENIGIPDANNADPDKLAAIRADRELCKPKREIVRVQKAAKPKVRSSWKSSLYDAWSYAPQD